jgi:hypothetical protein
MKTSTIILRFLREHPGELFCVRCLAQKLTGGTEITSTAIFEAEGLGARRTYGRCSACAQQRLVAGVLG